MEHTNSSFKHKLESYDEYRPAFQRHYQVYYAKSGQSFDAFDEAYQFGYKLALDTNRRNQYWGEIETNVESEWQAQGGSQGEPFLNAIRYAYNRFKHYLESEDDTELYAFFEPNFRRHFEDYYAKVDVEYQTYDHVYRFGYFLSMDPKFDFHDWFEIEPEIQEKWPEISTIPWDKDLSLTLRSAVEAVKRNFRLLDYVGFETTLRRHYYTHYARPEGKPFEWYEPAYRYGYDLAMDKHYRGKDWFSLEREIQTRWLARDYCPWEDVREASQRAWHEVKVAYGIEDTHDPTFSSLRRQYDDRFQEMGYPSDNLYEAGFRHGYFMAADERYRDLEWSGVLDQLRDHWQNNPMLGSWDNFRLSAQDGWKEVQKLLDK